MIWDTMFSFGKTLFVLGLCAFSSSGYSDVRLPNVFGDHMVLQRRQPIHVWGAADPGETIEVTFNRQAKQTRADVAGQWKVDLMPEIAGGPHILTVRGINTVQIHDVLVGDVWLASGQSNMEWTVRQSANSDIEIAQSTFPNIRHIKIPKRPALQPLLDTEASTWQVSGPESSGEFSAVGYFFARRIHLSSGVPIGIVNASWGGTNIEAWMSKSAFAKMPGTALPPQPADEEELRQRKIRRLIENAKRWQPDFERAALIPSGWKDASLPDSHWRRLMAPGVWEEQGLTDFDGVIWYRKDIMLTPSQAAKTATLNLGMIDDCDETFVNGHLVGQTCGWDTPRIYRLQPDVLLPGRNVVAVRVTDTGGMGGFHGKPDAMQLALDSERIALKGPWRARIESVLVSKSIAPNDAPSLIYNAMVHPLRQLPFRGVIWYQGEDNVSRAKQYEVAFPSLIEDWRRQWGNSDLPFYFVQLASFLPLEKNSLAGGKWAELRESQRMTQRVPHTGMVVTTDVGDANDIHPKDKQTVGSRLALHALKNEYDQADLLVDGPKYAGFKKLGATIQVSFAKGTGQPSVRGTDAILHGFTISDKSGLFRHAIAEIQGNTVVVSHPAIKKPTAVRYGWFDNPQEGNLVNEVGLPASPFRTDKFPLLTERVVYRQ